MAPKKSGKSLSDFSKESGLVQPAPAHWKLANDALALYKKGKRDKAIKELDSLLASQPSGAACLARAKILVWQAIEDGMKANNATAREVAMLPRLHEALRLAVEGGTEHRSIHCTRMAAVLALAASGRGGKPGEEEREPHLSRLKKFVDELEDGGRRESFWVPTAWEDVKNDRWPFEHGGQQRSVSSYIREAVQHTRDCVDGAKMQESYLQCLAASIKGIVSYGPSALDVTKRQQVVPVDRRLVDSGLLRQEDATALRGRYEEEQRQRAQRSAALTASSGVGRPEAPDSQLGERKGSGRLKLGVDEGPPKLTLKRVEVENRRRRADYMAAKIRAAKVVEFLEKEVLEGLSDKELQAQGVLSLTEVPLAELTGALSEQLSKEEVEDVMGNLRRAQAGVPVYYRWPESEEGPAVPAVPADAAGTAGAADTASAGSQGGAAAAAAAAATHVEYTEAEEFEGDLQARLLRVPLPDLAQEAVKKHVKGWKLGGRGPLAEEALDRLVCRDKSLLPDSVQATLTSGDTAAFLDRDTAIQQALQQQQPAAEDASGTPSQSEAGCSTFPPASAAAGGPAEELPADIMHLCQMQKLVTEPGGTFAARDKLGPVAWLEANRSLRDRSRVLMGTLDGSNLVDQEQVQALVHFRVGAMTTGAMRGTLQLCKDLAALRRWLLGSELMALGQAAGTVELGRLRRAQEMLRLQPSEEAFARLVELAEPDRAVQARLLQVASQCLKGLRHPAPGPAAALQPEAHAMPNGLSHAASEVLGREEAGGQEELLGDGECAVVTSQSERQPSKPPSDAKHSLREPGLSPLEDAALLALLRLPRPAEGTDAEQAVEQALQTKQELAAGVLAALRHLQSRGRLYQNALTTIVMFIWSTLWAQEQQQQGKAVAEAGCKVQGEEQKAQRDAEFAELYWTRLPEAMRAQLLRVGELPLLSLLQLQAYLAYLYAESFKEVADVCPQFQAQLYKDGARVEVDSARGVVRLTPGWLGELVQKKREVEQANGPIELKKNKKAAGAASAAGEAENGAATAPANPRAAAATSLQALAEHSFGATSALRRVRSQQLLAVDEEEEVETSKFMQRQMRVRRLLGVLGLLCPILGRARSLIADLTSFKEVISDMLARVEQGDAALLHEVGASWMNSQAEAFTALAEGAIKTHLRMETAGAALEFRAQASTMDRLTFLMRSYSGSTAMRIQDAVDYHADVRASCSALLAINSLQQTDNDLPGAAVQQRDCVKVALSQLQQAVALLEEACKGDSSGEALKALPSTALASAFISTLQAVQDLVASLDLGIARTGGLLEASHGAALALMGELCTHHCCFVCLDAVGEALVNYVLPSRWEQQMEQARVRGLAGQGEADWEAELLAMDQRKAAAEAAKAERKREKKKAKKAERRAVEQAGGQEQQSDSPKSQGTPAAPSTAEQQGSPSAEQKLGCAQVMAQLSVGAASPVAVLEETPSEPSPAPLEALGASLAAELAAEAGEGGGPRPSAAPAAEPAEPALEQRAGNKAEAPTPAAAPADVAAPAPTPWHEPAAEAQAQPAAAAATVAAADDDDGWEQAPSQRRRQTKHRQSQHEARSQARPHSLGAAEEGGKGSSSGGTGSQGTGATPAEQPANPAEDEAWQEASSQRRRQQGRQGAGPHAAGALGRAGPHAAAGRDPVRRVEVRGQEVLRIITWKGDWQCPCGRKCWPRQHCKVCHQYSPCRNWVFDGGCERVDCMFPHPPFDLPAEKPPVGPDGHSLEKGMDGKPYDIVKPHTKVHSSIAAAAQAGQAKPAPAAAGLGSNRGSQSGASTATPTSPVSQQQEALTPAPAAATPQPPAPPAVQQARPAHVPAPGAAAPPSSAPAPAAAAPPAHAAGPSSSTPARIGAPAPANSTAGAPQQTAPARLAPSYAYPPPPPPPAAAPPAPLQSASSAAAPAAPPLPTTSATAAAPPQPVPTAAVAAAPPQSTPTTAPAASLPQPSLSKKLNPNAPPWNGTFSATITTSSSSSSSSNSRSRSNAAPAMQPTVGAWSAQQGQQQGRQLQQQWQGTKGQQGPVTPAGSTGQPAAKQDKDAEVAVLLENLRGGTNGSATVARVQEEADVQAAVLASLADVRQSATAAAAGAPPATGAPAATTAAAAGAPPATGALAATTAAAAAEAAGSGLPGPTLSNEAGEYNCFLNAVLQCLWYCGEFRRQVAAWPPEFYTADPVVRALRDLFAAFAEKEKAGQNGSRGPQVGARHVSNPAPLREALAALPKAQFKLGEMNDASELLLTVYDHVRRLAMQQRRPSYIDSVFGLPVREAVQCGGCCKTTHQSNYTQYLYNTQATAIRMQLMVMVAEGQAAPSMGRLLREIEEQTLKSCDTDSGGCGELNPITHVLERPPRVFTMQLAWESNQEAGADIAATLAGVQEQLDLCELYRGPAGQQMYRLRSMVCYYGAHYQAFVLVPELGHWLMFDDTRITCIGDSFGDVRKKCEAGRIQPSALFYEIAK